mmetsp:Transcript_28704/g.72639  ORF Transcript_28704/g.72639 Transcript_28704/m.72639 type:complete len:215 (-) Transcript_28704:400-1044(-)
MRQRSCLPCALAASPSWTPSSTTRSPPASPTRRLRSPQCGTATPSGQCGLTWRTSGRSTPSWPTETFMLMLSGDFLRSRWLSSLPSPRTFANMCGRTSWASPRWWCRSGGQHPTMASTVSCRGSTRSSRARSGPSGRNLTSTCHPRARRKAQRRHQPSPHMLSSLLPRPTSSGSRMCSTSCRRWSSMRRTTRRTRTSCECSKIQKLSRHCQKMM